MIRSDDRLSEVLGRDAGMLDVIAAAAPQLRGLRNPVTRKVMGRLATIAQVARLAGIEPDLLVHRINRALGADTATGAGTDEATPLPHKEKVMGGSGPPAHLAAVSQEFIEDLDVREDLRNGREPFSRIMRARSALASGGVLRLRATFEPVPLYGVMTRQGFDHWTEELGADDWRVWFYPREMSSNRATAEADAPTEKAGHPAESSQDAGVVVLDVRDLDPPEPMVRTLAALEKLPAGGTLVQVNERVPQFLLPRLEELGFEHSIRDDGAGVVRVFIRRAADTVDG